MWKPWEIVSFPGFLVIMGGIGLGMGMVVGWVHRWVDRKRGGG